MPDDFDLVPEVDFEAVDDFEPVDALALVELPDFEPVDDFVDEEAPEPDLLADEVVRLRAGLGAS